MFDRTLPHPFVIVVIAALALTCSSSRAEDQATVKTTYSVTDFEQRDVSRITSLRPTPGSSAFTDGVLTCDFTGDPGYIGIGLDVEPLIGTPAAVQLSYESNTSGHPIVLRLQDSGGQFFQKQIAILDTDGSKSVIVPLSDMSSWFHFGGQNDGVPRPPLRVAEIIVDHDGPDTSLKLLELLAITEVPLDQAVTCRFTGRMRFGSWETLSLTCRSLLAETVPATISWTVTDIFGKQVGVGRRHLSMAPHPEVVLPIRVRVRDVRLVDVKLDVDVKVKALEGSAARPLKERQGSASVAEETIRLTRTVSTSVVGPPGTDARTDDLHSDSPFGMGIYLGQRYPIDKMDMVATMGHDIGVKWMRDEFNWGRIEPERGKWNWAPYDKAVDAARRNGISIFGLLCYWSPWTTPYTEEGIRDYCDYVKAVVGRYKDRIKHWEIWNEPNIFFWQGTVEQYADLLKAAYIAVKEADPDAQVIGCCTAGTDLKFIERVLELGGYDKMDILSIHPYRYPATPEQTDFIGELKKADALMKKYGGSKPIWLTEIGWPTNVGSNGSSDAKQAAMIVRTYIQAIVSGVAQKTFWYNYRNDGTDPNYNEHNFGIIRQDYSTKPAYVAFGAMTRSLVGKEFIKALDMPDGVCAYRFEGLPPDPTIAAWCVSGTSIMTVMSGTRVFVMDIVGTKKPVEPVDGRVDIPLSQFPVFVSGLSTNARVTASGPVAESVLTDPVAVTILPKSASSFAVELRRQGKTAQPAKVHVRLPGYADTFDLSQDKGSHTEPYDLPDGMSISGGKILPVAVTVETGNRRMSKTSNVSYTQCRQWKYSCLNPPVDIWSSAPIKLGRVGDWEATDGGGLWTGADDLSADVGMSWRDGQLLLYARVRDDVFSCDYKADEIWKGDSIQFAIDPGHTEDVALGRAYEIGLAMTPGYVPQVWCWSAPAGEQTGPIEAGLDVKRDGEYTYYSAEIPLSALPSLKPAVGKVIGFSILVNDNDGQGRKGWLQWTPGIGRGKSPALYGDLVFSR